MKHGLLIVILFALARIEGLAQVVDSDVKFEVASVKPSQPPDANAMVCKGGPGSIDPGFFTCSNVNITNLVGRAFRLMPYQLPSTDTGGPVLYEISAKIPPGTTADEFNLMLRNLLVERFKLAYHYAKKEMQVYDLVVAKGGLKMKESVPADPPVNRDERPDGAPPRVRKLALDDEGFPKVAAAKRGSSSMAMTNGRARWTASEIGMEHVVGMLSAQMGGPITDSTGLRGKYDFTLSWALQSNAAGDPPGPTLVEAIREQMGLKLESKKGFVDIFVIDHVEKVPVEN